MVYIKVLEIIMTAEEGCGTWKVCLAQEQDRSVHDGSCHVVLSPHRVLLHRSNHLIYSLYMTCPLVRCIQDK